MMMMMMVMMMMMIMMMMMMMSLQYIILFLELKRLSMGLTALKSEAVDKSSVFPLQYLSKRTLLDS